MRHASPSGSFLPTAEAILRTPAPSPCKLMRHAMPNRPPSAVVPSSLGPLWPRRGSVVGLLALLSTPVVPVAAQPVSLGPASSSIPSSTAFSTPAPPPASTPPPPIYLWGISRGDCATDATLTEHVQKQFEGDRASDPSARWNLSRLSSTSAGALPACSGPQSLSGTACAQALARLCPAAKGWLLGGQLEGPPPPPKDPKFIGATRLRLWLYDLAQARRIVQDDYWQFNGATTAELVAAHARTLLRNAQDPKSPLWEPLVNDWLVQGRPPQPAYLSPPPSPAATDAPLRPPVVLWLPNLPSDPAQAPTPSTLKTPTNGQKAPANGQKAPANGQKAPIPVPEPPSIGQELKESKDDVSRLVNNLWPGQVVVQTYTPGQKPDTVIASTREYYAKQKVFSWRAVVLGIDASTGSGGTASRKLTLTLADAAYDKSDKQSIPCTVKDSCAASVRANAGWLPLFLGQCFAQQCAGKQRESVMPDSAKLSFQSPSCPVQPLPPPPPSAVDVEKQNQAEAPRKNAWRALIVLPWVGAVLSLGTAGVLGILDLRGDTLPNRFRGEPDVIGAYQPAIVASFCLGLALTGLSVGSTVLAHRLLPPPKASGPIEPPAPWLQCPVPPKTQTSAKTE